MRTFLNHIRNETLDEIKTSLENLWQQMIQLSEFFQYSFVLILKRKCLVRASRVRSGESGTPSTIIYVRWSSRRYELGCDAPVIQTCTWHMFQLGYSGRDFWILVTDVLGNETNNISKRGTQLLSPKISFSVTEIIISRYTQNCWHFEENPFKCIFIQNIFIFIEISMKFVPVSNGWCQAGDKKLPEHTEAQTRSPPFRSQHYQMHFLEWKSKNGCHFEDDILNSILFNENVSISIEISLVCSQGPIDNMPTFVQIMAWCRPGNKPLFEPMLVGLLTHWFITRPPWVKGYFFWFHIYMALEPGQFYFNSLVHRRFNCDFR